jgi:transposase-like protein
VKIKGSRTYLYRAVDSERKTADFQLRAKRDVAAAKTFFRRAFKTQGRLPHAIALEGYRASHRAAREFPGEHRHSKRTKLRSSKYLNNLIGDSGNASITISGIELMHRIRKRQFNLDKLSTYSKTTPEIWNAVLAA